MADLPTYLSPAAKGGLQPSDRGSAAAVMEGGAWNRAFHSLGDAAQDVGDAVERHNAAQDASKLSKEYAETFAKLNDNWNTAATQADPNATDTGDKWRQQTLEPTLEAIGADVQSKHGKEIADGIRNDLRKHFYEKTIGDEASLNKNAIQSNLETATNVLSQTVRKDPTSLDAALDMMHALVSAQVKAHPGIGADAASKITGELTGKIEKEVAVSAFQGMAEVNAPAAIQALADGKFAKYFNGTEAGQLDTYARNQQKLNITLEQKANKEQAEKEASQITASTIGANGQLTLPKDYYANVAAWAGRNAGKPGMEGVASQTSALVNFGRAIQSDLENGTPVETDPHTYGDFRNRAFLAQTDPRRLTDVDVLRARADHKLNDKDYTFFNHAVTELSKDESKSASQRDFDNFLKSYKGYITKSSFLKVDAYGDQKFYEWSARAQQMHDEMAAQKVPEKDIRDAITKVLPQYQISKDTAIQSVRERATTGLKPLPAGPNAPKRAAGESAADFLKRTGH